MKFRRFLLATLLATAILYDRGLWASTSLPFYLLRTDTVPTPEWDTAPYADSLHPCFLTLADIHFDGRIAQANMKNGDAGYDLWDSVQHQVASLLRGGPMHRTPDFVVVLGDLPAHNEEGAKGLLDARHNIVHTMADLKKLSDTSGVPFFLVPGNNDSWAGDYARFSDQPFQDPASGMSAPLLTQGRAVPVDTSRWRSLGCYSVNPVGNNSRLRLIVLNTVMFVHSPRYLYSPDAEDQRNDIGEQMSWLEHQMEQVRRDSAIAWIAMHVPPGADGYNGKPLWSFNDGHPDQPIDRLLALLHSYRAQIAGLLSAHSHMDGFRRLLDKNGQLITFDSSTPGIAMGHGNNAAIKLISSDSSYQARQAVTFYLDGKTFPKGGWRQYTVSLDLIRDTRRPLDSLIQATYKAFSGASADQYFHETIIVQEK